MFLFGVELLLFYVANNISSPIKVQFCLFFKFVLFDNFKYLYSVHNVDSGLNYCWYIIPCFEPNI